MLTVEQRNRYARHLILPGFGEEAQQRLLDRSVLVVGVGGLGSPAALYLAAAGVGRIGIVDDDVVDVSNLQRQILHRTPDEGVPKTESARRALSDLNPEVVVDSFAERLNADNAERLIGGYDLVICAVDNFPARYLINQAAVAVGRPVVHGAVYHFEGQVSVFDAAEGPCYSCLFPEPPAETACAEKGVLGVLPGVIGVLQATEAVKLLTGVGEPLVGRMLLYDALKMQFRTLRVKKQDGCAVCGRMVES